MSLGTTPGLTLWTALGSALGLALGLDTADSTGICTRSGTWDGTGFTDRLSTWYRTGFGTWCCACFVLKITLVELSNRSQPERDRALGLDTADSTGICTRSGSWDGTGLTDRLVWHLVLRSLLYLRKRWWSFQIGRNLSVIGCWTGASKKLQIDLCNMRKCRLQEVTKLTSLDWKIIGAAGLLQLI
jgi:hypothetical protein